MTGKVAKTILVLLLTIVLIAASAFVTGYAITGQTNPVKWLQSSTQPKDPTDKDPDEPNQPTDKEDNGGTVIDKIEGSGIRLLSAQIPRAAYAANDISPQADSAYLLTAVIEPDDVTDKTVDWTITWKNANSAFAAGKSVTDYVTVTPTSDGALTARAACSQAFAEQILITVKPRKAIRDISATCTVDYVQKFLGMGFKATCEQLDYGFEFTTVNLNPVIDFPVFTNVTDWEYGFGKYPASKLAFVPELSTVYTRAIDYLEDGYYPGYKVAVTQEYITALRAGGVTSSITAEKFINNGNEYISSFFFLNWGSLVTDWTAFLTSLKENSDKPMLRVKCMSHTGNEEKESWTYNIKFDRESIANFAANIKVTDHIEF